MYQQRIQKKKKVKIVCPNQVPVATPIPSVSSEYDYFPPHFQAAYNTDKYNCHYINFSLFIYTVIKQSV